MPDSTYLQKGPCRNRAKGGAENSRMVRDGFTMIEIIIVAVILSIVALTVVPMFSSAGTMQLRAASNMLAADMEYAKSMAISTGQSHSVVIDQNAENYRIEDQNGNVIPHPVKKGFAYVIDFQNDSRLSRVDIAGADFGGTAKVTYDSLGSPDNGGTVTLQASGSTVTVTVEPVTGYISIQ